MNGRVKKSGSVLVVAADAAIPRCCSASPPEGGLACTTAPTVDAALEILAGRTFDFVLADVPSPDEDGLEPTRRIKQEHPGTAVIAMTGQGDRYPYDKVLEAGADDFLRKPFSAVEVLARAGLVQRRLDLHRWAVTDELTGVYNRKGFFTLGQHLLKVSRRTREEMFLLYVDLDNLKTINDTCGHQAGDLALQDIARITKASFRESDIVARIGGDEFVVFPVGSTAGTPEILVSRFEEALARHNDTEERPYLLAMSYGIACFDPDRPLSLDELLIEADKAMYGRKSRKKSAPSLPVAPQGPGHRVSGPAPLPVPDEAPPLTDSPGAGDPRT